MLRSMSRRPRAEGEPSSVDSAEDYEPEKNRRPKDTPFRQQRVSSFLPILRPGIVVGIFLAIGVVFVPLGKWFMDESDTVVEYTVRYDVDSDDVVGCEIEESNEGGQCTVEIEVEEYMSPPIYVYYKLDNFYQNHRRYVKSRSSSQLLGQTVVPDDFCDPLSQDENDLDLNPCGLIANSMFNDIITLISEDVNMSEEDISWESDREERFKQPPGFVYVAVGGDDCPSKDSTCDECLSGDNSPYDGCESYFDEAANKTYKYWYPDNNTTTFLYETYGDIVSPIEGVLNEHFIVWMRTAGLSQFRKVYGRIDEGLSPPQVLKFNITSNFNVADFSGKKSLVVSNLSLMGARNPYLGIAYIALGSLSLAIGVAFAIKHLANPRKLGDTKFLVWKDTTM